MPFVHAASPWMKGLMVAAGVAVTAFSILMLSKIVPYLSLEKGIHFLTTKSAATNNSLWFRLGFYVHITSSWGVLVAGLLQLIPAVFRRNPATHRWLGKLYVATILALAAPSGLVLALFANGGLAAKVGFVMQCIVWWLATWQAYRAVRRQQWLPHAEWMLRSYAITLAAMSLRLESYGLYYFFGTKPIETYLTVTWLSWTGNLVLLEVLIQLGLARWYVRQFTPKPLFA